MDKEEAIKGIIDLQKQASKVLGSYAVESWRHLDVPMAQLKSLFIITSKGETNLSMLAQELGVTSGNVTGIVDRLADQGLVIRNPDPLDRRVIRLEATDKGRELLSNLMESQGKQMAHILTHMQLEELTCLLQGLAGLIRAVDEHRQEAIDGTLEKT